MDFFSGFVELIKQGGVVMIILILMSIIAVAIVIERLWFFQRESADSKALLRSLGQRVAADDMAGAIKVAKSSKGMLPRILEFGLRARIERIARTSQMPFPSR